MVFKGGCGSKFEKLLERWRGRFWENHTSGGRVIFIRGEQVVSKEIECKQPNTAVSNV